MPAAMAADHDRRRRAPARRSSERAGGRRSTAPATEPASTSSAAPAGVRRLRVTRASATASRRHPAAQSRAASAAAKRSPSLTMYRSPRSVHRTMRVGRKRPLWAGSAASGGRLEACRRRPAPRRLLLARPRGYCAGVERAVEAVEQMLVLHGPPIYVRKQIVHNIHVVRRLEQQGAIFVESEEDVPEGATDRALGPRRRARGAPQRGAAAAARDRRDLPARDQGAQRGPPLRRPGLHDLPDRPRGPRGGRRHDGRGARRDRARADGRATSRCCRSRAPRSSPTSRRRRSRSTRRPTSSPPCSSASRRSSGRPRTTSATRPPTARPPSSRSRARSTSCS